MKKLLSIFAASSFIVSSTTSTIVSCSIKSKNLDSLNYNWDLGLLEKVNQEEIIKKIAQVNNINKDNYKSKQKDIENLASIFFDYSSIKLISDSNDKKTQTYSATVRASKNSNIMKGNTTITFDSTQDAVKNAKNPINQQESNLMGTWWNWGNTYSIKNDKVANCKREKVEEKENYFGLGWREPSLEAIIQAKMGEKKVNPYNIINISSLYTKAGEYEIDSLNINDFNPNSIENNAAYDIKNSQFLINRKNSIEAGTWTDNTKIITSLGGATADRMIWKWKQKQSLKDKIKDILTTYGLDGLDIALAGKTLYDRDSQETLSQAVKEIMVEYWLEGKDFYLTISSKMEWLYREAIETNKPTVIPFIQSLEGWYKDITLLVYNINRPTHFFVAPETFTVGDTTIQKGEKIRSKLSPSIEDPAYFYGTLRGFLDPEWNKNSRFYDLSNKAIRIGTASPYSSTSSAFGFKNESDKLSNLAIALQQLHDNSKELNKEFTKNIVGFNYFGINIDQIFSNNSATENQSINEHIKNPTAFKYGSSLDWFINENMKQWYKE
ncbi:hypothetical protein [Spiroplasma floricola]|uniref:GH18 domain-containing protein n=1 Tax=Spiroplasma floricola 23-6 TaxID=1336749 RepID=A0A2K8SEN1_9MOLU|nr:hypothetical protein [Spiroplasma floricola]AUB31863.1 hypothetical protein SFLOR_v1c08150 [Spiroplasma floricola 23-6]